MGILDKVLGKGDEEHTEAQAQTPTTPETEVECPHTAMTPHWDALDDMGKNELATYTCEACGRMFNYEQAKVIMETPPAAVAAASDGSHDDYAKS
jgi:hypothetical protein